MKPFCYDLEPELGASFKKNVTEVKPSIPSIQEIKYYSDEEWNMEFFNNTLGAESSSYKVFTFSGLISIMIFVVGF